MRKKREREREKLDEAEAPVPSLSARVIHWLDRREQPAPQGIDQAEWDYAARYARGRYEIGVDHYRDVFHALGWTNLKEGLDCGSGSGHWAIAFALDNERATGIDRNDAFVHLANSAATVAGVGGRVRHQIGSIEALPFPDQAFDAVWSHGVLMFCDPADSFSEIARVLKPGGQFYCGYSSFGSRLAAIYHRFLDGDRQQLGSQIGSYIGLALQRKGLARTPWGMLRSASVDELAKVCRAYDLHWVAQPGSQDGAAKFAGIPGTIDLLCIKSGKNRSIRTQITGLSLAKDETRRRLWDLIALGLGKLVYRILNEIRAPLNDPDIRSMYVLAAIGAGHGEAAADYAEQGIDPLVSGLLALDRSEFLNAETAFRRLAISHPDRSFLLGTALLLSGAPDDALDVFEQGAHEERQRHSVECALGAILARIESAEWPELGQRVATALRLLPGALGASKGEIDLLIADVLASRSN